MTSMVERVKLSEADLVLLFEAWDRLDQAIQRTTVALPAQLTAASAQLEHERRAMRSVIQSVFIGGTNLAALKE